jgi:anthranilate synthase component I
VVAKSQNSQYPPNVLPLTASIPADLLTPTVAYLKIAAKYVHDILVMLDSVE